MFLTRSGAFYSPYHTETTINIDSLLHDALSRAPDSFDSPLTSPECSPTPSPASSRCASPSPAKSMPDEDTNVTFSSTPNVTLPPTPDSSSKPDANTTKKLYPQEGVPRKRPKSKKRTEKDKKRSKQQRDRKQKGTSIAVCRSEAELKAYVQENCKFVFESAQRVPGTVDTQSLPATSTGYLGKVQDKEKEEQGLLPEHREYSLSELVDKKNFEVIWYEKGVTKYIASKGSGGIMAAIVPGPNDDVDDPEWKPVREGAENTIKTLWPLCLFDPNGRRGLVNPINYGISFGNGQLRPMVLSDQGKQNLLVMELIRQCVFFQRIAGWMSVCFLTWAPRLFIYYVRIMSLLFQQQTGLDLPFENCIFAGFTVNFGPRTICLPHRDSKNLVFGWCAITALGNYDYTQGGHLVLWDLKKVIEFPPGCTIFLPSAVLCHFNTPIADHETQYSFTMYTSGGIFRWVKHGFQLEYLYQKTARAARDAANNAQRWAQGLSLFSTIEELLSPSSVE
ncbi:hypothetical protein V5O48_013497 [Marasmius crinis-equi]|uniref:Prolyl 4-hydroxylase alpha subunit Fe(2+) 2OG dioxygenase domain-containing protein n=1 Tax=Marasmius crinis-equi TaxID=585013 RepID=A0ABR3EZX1_9AGAR